MKVFLGGTCNNSKWRDELITMLAIDYFNPVVDDWTPECQDEELHQREICDWCLYVITPKMKGVYSIAEAVDDSNKRKVIFVYLKEDAGLVFDEAQLKSLDMVSKLIYKNKGVILESLEEVATFLNCYATLSVEAPNMPYGV